MRVADEHIPKLHSDWVIKARLSGSSSGFARVHFKHEDAGIQPWGEGSEVWYEASFYLKPGFYKAKSSTKDLMRWDAYVSSREQDMQGGLGMASDSYLMIMSNYPYTRPLETNFKIPEAKWTHVHVHQIISQHKGTALNEIIVDGQSVGRSDEPNYKGSGTDDYPYADDEQAITRLRVGLVSEGSVSDDHTLYVDGFKLVVAGAGGTS